MIKKCPNCFESYADEYVSCPVDGILLRVLPNNSPTVMESIIYWAKGPMITKAKVCPECGAEYSLTFEGRCTFDDSEMELIETRVVPPPPLPVADRYKLVQYVGSRKLTKCFMAVDTQTGEDVFVQFMSRMLARDEKTVERFLKGANSSSRLSHPSIYKIHDVGTLESLPYIVGEPFVGSFLQSVLSKQGRLPTAGAIPVFIQILDALEFAHKKGIIHNNMTTSNILLAQKDADPRVKVMEFGIAERLFRDLEWDGLESATRTINVYGETSAMSPEVMRGRKSLNQSDLYSLGCIMYEVLAGKPPYDGGSEILTLMYHLNNEPEPFKEELAVPKELEAVVLKCLEKEPEDRFASAGEVKSLLESI